MACNQWKNWTWYILNPYDSPIKTFFQFLNHISIWFQFGARLPLTGRSRYILSDAATENPDALLSIWSIRTTSQWVAATSIGLQEHNFN